MCWCWQVIWDEKISFSLKKEEVIFILRTPKAAVYIFTFFFFVNIDMIFHFQLGN